MMRRAGVVAVAVLAVGGCATQRQVLTAPVAVREAQVVEVPVPVPCLAAAQLPGPPPVMSEAELAALPDFEAVIALEQQRRALAEYSLLAAALLQACAGGSR